MTGLFYNTLATILFVSLYNLTFYIIFVVFSVTILYGIISGFIISVIDKKPSISFLKKGIFSMILMNCVIAIAILIISKEFYLNLSTLIGSIILGVLLGHNYETYMKAPIN